MATIVCLTFDFGLRQVTALQATQYVKNMVCFKIRRAVVSENLEICMLIEHDCVCQIKLWNEGADAEVPLLGGGAGLFERQSTIMNELEQELA